MIIVGPLHLTIPVSDTLHHNLLGKDCSIIAVHAVINGRPANSGEDIFLHVQHIHTCNIQYLHDTLRLIHSAG